MFIQNLTTNIVSSLTWHQACVDIIWGVLFHTIIEIWLTVGVCWLFVTRAWQALFESECILTSLLSSVVRWGMCWSLMLIYASRAWLDLTILQVFVLINLLKFWIVASISIRNSYPTHFLMSLDERFQALIFHMLSLLVEAILWVIHLRVVHVWRICLLGHLNISLPICIQTSMSRHFSFITCWAYDLKVILLVVKWKST